MRRRNISVVFFEVADREELRRALHLPTSEPRRAAGAIPPNCALARCPAHSYFRSMKRPLLLAGLVCLPLSLSAQDPAAIAAREEAEARYTRMNTRVQELEEANVSFQKRMQALTEEIRGLRDEIDRLRNKNDNAVTQESLKRLTDA